MRTNLSILLIALSPFACSSTNASTDANANDATDAYVDAAPPPDGPSHTFTMTIGPFPLAAGQEQTLCVLARMTNATPQFIQRVSAHLTNSHHLVAFRSSVATEQTVAAPCHAFSGVDPMNGLDESPLIIAQQEDAQVVMPDHVGMHLATNQMLRLELHMINVTGNATQAMGTVTFDTVDDTEPLQPADVMFWGNLGISIPPHTTDAQVHFFHQPVAGAHIFGLTSHTHSHGTLATISAATNATSDPTMATDIQLLHRSMTWSDPPLTVFPGGGLQLPDGQGLHLVCHYDNDTDTTITYGESAATNEMCFMWAYFWPAPMGQESCFDTPGNPGTQCFPY